MHVREIGRLVTVRGRGDADEDDACRSKGRRLGRGAEPSRVGVQSEPLGRHVFDVADAGVQRGRPFGVEVEAEDREPRIGGGHGEGQPDVAEPDDADHELARSDELIEVSHGSPSTM